MSILGLVLVVSLAQAAPSPVAAQAAAPPSSVSAAGRAEAYYHFSLGLQARLAGDAEEALAEYRRAQKLDPGASAIRVETARLLKDMMKVDEAEAEARAAIAIDKGDADAHLVLAQLQAAPTNGPASERAFRAAAQEYEEVVRLRPTDGQSLLALAALYGQLAAGAEGRAEQDYAAAAHAWGRYVELDPGNFEAHVQLGSNLLMAGQPEKAAAALKSALELQPGNARAYQILGEIYARAEQSDQAVLHYRKALELEPQNLRLRLALGEVLQQSKRLAEALAEADAVLQADGSNRFALELKGRCLRDLKRYEEASAAAEALLASDPNDLKAAYLQVTIAEARRDYAAAAAILERVIARQAHGDEESAANQRVFLLHLGFAYQQLDRYADAATAFGNAVKASGPQADATVLNFHAEALYLAKQKAEALSAVRAARERYPDDVDLTGLEATLLREKGDTAAASALVEKMRDRAPKDPKVLARVADFYRRAKQFPAAEATLRQARQADPKNLSVLFQLGAVLERQKRHDEAEAVFRDALAVEPDSAPVLNYLGYMNADRSVKLEESLALIQRAIELDPASGAYKDSLGWALYRLNRLDAAEQAVRKALENDGNNAVVLDHLGDILAKRGRVADAVQYWQKALKGEDEDGELERPRVEAKIRDGQGVLQAQQQAHPPATP